MNVSQGSQGLPGNRGTVPFGRVSVGDAALWGGTCRARPEGVDEPRDQLRAEVGIALVQQGAHLWPNWGE